MGKIDLKDKKILYHLLINSRQPLSKIGKKVGQSKELVAYRIKRMEEKGIIKKFTTMTDGSKFGIQVLSYYYKFDNINPSIRNQLIKLLVDSKFTRYVASLESKYDLYVWYYLLDPNEFIKFYEDMLRNYRKYLADQIIAGDIGVELFPHDFLLSENKRQITKIKSKKTTSEWFIKEKIDKLNILTLKELSKNPRIKLIEIAKNLESTVNIIKYRINELIDDGIIFGFSTIIDWSKIEYKYFTLEMFLNDYNQKNKILNYIKTNPNLIKIFTTFSHGIDIKCDIIVNDIEHLRDIIEDISNKFPNDIKNIDYFNTYKINKIDHLPPI